MSVAVLVVIVLTGVWFLIIGEFSPGQALLGLLFGALFVLATGAGRGRRMAVGGLPRRIGYLAFYLFLLLPYDVVRSNLQMARRLLRRTPLVRPGIVRVPLEDIPKAAVALEEHGITLSPGQMVVDYARDERTAYVHLIDVAEAEGREGALWRLYREVLRKVFS